MAKWLRLAAAAPIIMSAVHAADVEDEPKKVRISELPLYGRPQEKTKPILEEEPSTFLQYITEVRKAVWSFMDSVKTTKETISDKIEIGKAHTRSSLDHLHNDPGIVRVAVISVAGLGGVLAGYKRGPVRKVFYGSFAALTAAVICFPKEAVEIVQQGADLVQKQVSDLRSKGGKSDES